MSVETRLADHDLELLTEMAQASCCSRVILLVDIY